MDTTIDFRAGRHVVYIMHVHLVFITKYQRPVFAALHLTRMEEIMREVCKDFEAELVEFSGAANHVHLLVTYPPKVAVSKLVNSLKGVSSRLMRKEFEDLRFAYWNGARLWSGSYFAGSVGGAPISVAHQYIQQEARPSV
ncbi:IS200/IS605 family transposase [Nocardia sp. CDC160]|uniref:IS200/IS605 family transposase n=1 Tax=Nocardia sp. CDC160 TaxID=3112166 RepID=UPI002DBD097D|nr:IS200/IS605 family transposase [Nocardia sp. CDC160]MEC3917797.1 IS200/IS605 family transposase [Nocardia sp. CDC160]